MNDRNRIADVDLSQELSAKINNPSNCEEVVLIVDGWVANEMTSEVPEGLEYMYVCPIEGIVSSSFVNAIFDNTSKEIALDYGVHEDIFISKDEIVFFSEEQPSEDLNVTIYYIK